MRNQVEGFKISCVRQLRTSTDKLVELCEQIPKSILFYLQNKFDTITLKEMDEETNSFSAKHATDRANREEHLRLFRPNLENPANKQLTKDLDTKERARCEEFKEVSFFFLLFNHIFVLVDRRHPNEPVDSRGNKKR